MAPTASQPFLPARPCSQPGKKSGSYANLLDIGERGPGIGLAFPKLTIC